MCAPAPGPFLIEGTGIGLVIVERFGVRLPVVWGTGAGVVGGSSTRFRTPRRAGAEVTAIRHLTPPELPGWG
jgi:hypothetical protein